MDTLDGSKWDVLIAGTGIQQSLLALALSHSGKKILHVDKNDYYGGAEAAFSLQEAETWVQRIKDGTAKSLYFSNASLQRLAEDETGTSRLSFSRAYSLSLAPEIIYSRSNLLPLLVSSKVYRQLEFQAVGSWWLFSSLPGTNTEENEISERKLLKVPSGREDIFADDTLDLRSRRALMKFLKFVAEHDQMDDWEEAKKMRPFPVFLAEDFGLPPALHGPLLALLQLPQVPNDIPTARALPRIARHLRSIGVFGPGFAAVLPRWGGLAEIAQVACRANAVGGGVYVLGRGINALEIVAAEPESDADGSNKKDFAITLDSGENMTAQWVAGCRDDLPASWPMRSLLPSQGQQATLSRSVSIVSSALSSLFPELAEGAPPPAVAVVFFPSGSLSVKSGENTQLTLPPVHVFVHSSDTGECPVGQSVLYASTALTGEQGSWLLEEAVRCLLASIEANEPPVVLWSLNYEQRSTAFEEPPSQASGSRKESNNLLEFPQPSLDLAFDDRVLDAVKTAWECILGDEAKEFMVFGDREEIGSQSQEREA